MPRKRNASGVGSIRQRSDGRWEARITVGTDPGTGRPVRRSIYGNTQKEVLVAMRDAQKSVDDGLYIEPTRLTLAQWLDIWQRDYLLSQKYGTVKTYRAQIATHIKPALGAVKLSKLTPHLVQSFYNDLLARGRTVPKRDEAGKIIKKNGEIVTEQGPAQCKNCEERPRCPHKGPFASREAGLHRTKSLRHGRLAPRRKDGDRPAHGRTGEGVSCRHRR